MNLTEKILREFEKKFIENKREDGEDYTPYLRDIDIKSFLLSSLKQVATEAIEAVRLEERGNDTYKSFHEVGYNSAIEDMKQKAKKFLDENFKS